MAVRIVLELSDSSERIIDIAPAPGAEDGAVRVTYHPDEDTEENLWETTQLLLGHCGAVYNPTFDDDFDRPPAIYGEGVPKASVGDDDWNPEPLTWRCKAEWFRQFAEDRDGERLLRAVADDSDDIEDIG